MSEEQPQQNVEPQVVVEDQQPPQSEPAPAPAPVQTQAVTEAPALIEQKKEKNILLLILGILMLFCCFPIGVILIILYFL